MASGHPPNDEPPVPRAGRFAAALQRALHPETLRRQRRRLAGLLRPQAAPLDMAILGRTLLHASLVGLGAGIVGAAFLAALELLQRVLLEQLAGYSPLRASGEKIIREVASPTFRPWLLVFIPAAGALVAGLVMRFAPETRGGGGDAMIEAFHHQGGIIRRRVLWVKWLASTLTLGSGGSGGREGPTMQIGGALGSLVAGALGVSARERRILLVAGVAAGMSAVFRTPLGAAILAVEVLYRDDFETEALVPAVLASVVAYSVVISIYGESTLLAHAPHYPFVPVHLPLYILLAVLLALVAKIFLGTLRLVQRTTAKLAVPVWIKPALGGLAFGVTTVPLLVIVGNRLSLPGQGLGIFGGGYGAAQMAITGSPLLPGGWTGVELLLFLCAAKLVASSLTIGSGGSAGDFAPSLVLGGLFGGAFGRAAALLLHDPRIDPGAFALVGMGTLYGGIAHVPLSSLIMVCELAGSYELLVPLMLAEGVAFVALRGTSLYGSQVASKQDSPAHRLPAPLDTLRTVKVHAALTPLRAYVTFARSAKLREMLARLPEATWQDAFPVADKKGRFVGLVTSDALRLLASKPDRDTKLTAADIMQPIVTLSLDDELRTAAELMLANGLREIPVLDAGGAIIGFLDEAEVSRAYLQATAMRGEGEDAGS